MLTESCVIFFAVPSRLRRCFAGRGILQNAEMQNAERRTQNAERRTQNAERRTQNAERRTQNDGQRYRV